jgi:hypothetical protein
MPLPLSILDPSEASSTGATPPLGNVSTLKSFVLALLALALMEWYVGRE